MTSESSLLGATFVYPLVFPRDTPSHEHPDPGHAAAAQLPWHSAACGCWSLPWHLLVPDAVQLHNLYCCKQIKTQYFKARSQRVTRPTFKCATYYISCKIFVSACLLLIFIISKIIRNVDYSTVWLQGHRVIMMNDHPVVLLGVVTIVN